MEKEILKQDLLLEGGEKLLEKIKAISTYKVPDLVIYYISHLRYTHDSNSQEPAFIRLQDKEIVMNFDKIFDLFYDYYSDNKDKIKDNDIQKLWLYTCEMIFIHEVLHFVLRHYSREKRFVRRKTLENKPISPWLMRTCVEIECNNILASILKANDDKMKNSMKNYNPLVYDKIEFMHALGGCTYKTIPKDIRDKVSETHGVFFHENMSFEELYDAIEEELPDEMKNKKIVTWEKVEDDTEETEITPPAEEMESLCSLDTIDDILKSIGSASSNLVTKIKRRLMKVFVPDFKVITNYIEQKGKHARYTYLKYNYLNDNNLNIHRGRKHVNKQMSVGIVVDTSASVNDKQLEALYSLYNELIKKFSKIKVIEIDTEIKSVKEIRDIRDLKKEEILDISGRGGTDLQPGIDYLENDKSIDQIIVITDGFVDSIKRYKKPILAMLYDKTNCTEEKLIECGIPFYYLTNL